MQLDVDDVDRVQRSAETLLAAAAIVPLLPLSVRHGSMSYRVGITIPTFLHVEQSSSIQVLFIR